MFVHPGFPPHALPLEHHPVWLYEFTFETVRAVANLIYSGALERYPRIRFQLAHLGGAVPFLAHRIASLADRVPEAASQAPAGALEYLKRFYYDTGLADNAAALAATREIVPADRIVYGTDWPYAVDARAAARATGCERGRARPPAALHERLGSAAMPLRAIAAIAFALALVPAAPAAAATRTCKSADLRYPFQPGGPKTFGVFHLRVTRGTCTTAHRVAKAWMTEFEERLRGAGESKLPRRIAGFPFTELPPTAAQTYRLRGVKGTTRINFDYVVPNG